MSSSASPLLSIIIPSFNQGDYLAESIQSALDQDYRPIEILVMDGGSTDNTVEVLETFGGCEEVQWWSEKDSGPAEAVNKGLQKAAGLYASIQSADDYYLPGAFAKAMASFEANVDIGLLYGEVKSVTADGRVVSESHRPPHSNALCIALCICIPQCSAFFRTELARDLGGWRTLYHTADWDLWIRMMFRTKVVKVDDAMSCWRMYPGQRTDQRQKVYNSYRRMIAESEEIQRGGLTVRRAAVASRFLIAISFGKGSTRIPAVLSFMLAVVCFPSIFSWVPRKRKLVPGYGRIAAWMAR